MLCSDGSVRLVSSLVIELTLILHVVWMVWCAFTLTSQLRV